jgi:tRNA (guanine-N7-)-methyltransferase
LPLVTDRERPDSAAGAVSRPTGTRARTFFGRRHGKALRPAQRRHLATLLPRLRLTGIDPAENPARAVVDLAAHHPGFRTFWLEIGFGGGEHLHRLAQAHPEVGFIGCEPFVNGVAMLLGKLAEADPGNVWIHPGEARDLLDVIAPATLGRVYLLYPDPWPKPRHRKRRFLSGGNLAALARAMAPGAELLLATDIADYALHAAAETARVAAFEPLVSAAPDWHQPWSGWTGTRYEAKALRAGRRPHYLIWRRR